MNKSTTDVYTVRINNVAQEFSTQTQESICKTDNVAYNSHNNIPTLTAEC